MRLRRVSLFLIFISLGYLGVCADARAEGKQEDTVKTILSLERAALDRSDKGDPMGFIEISTPDVTYIDPYIEKPLSGIESLRNYYLAAKFATNIEGKILQERVQLSSDDVAVLTYNYVGKGLPGQGWNCTEVYRRTKEGWRIFHTHWSFRKGESPLTASPSGEDLPKMIVSLELSGLAHDSGDKFLHLSDSEVVYIDPSLDKPIWDRAALEKLYFPNHKHESGSCKAEMLNSKVQVVGTAAVLSFNYKNNICEDWNATEVYHKTPKGWRIQHTHWSYTKALPAQQ